MSILAAFSGVMLPTTGATGNLQAYAGAIGGLAQPGGLILSQDFTHNSTTNATRTNRQTVIFAFTSSVTGLPVAVSALAVTVTDVDSATSSWWDVVELSTAAGYAATPAAAVAGGSLGPWSTTSANAPFATTDGSGNVALQFTSPVTTFTIVYWNKQSAVVSAGGGQLILLSNMSFSYAANTC